MSTGLELIPFALAVAGGAGIAVAAGSSQVVPDAPREVRSVSTRFKDGELLLEALGEGAGERDGAIHGAVEGLPVAFATGPDGAYVAYFHGEVAPAQAEAAVLGLDAAYGGLVQRNARDRVIAQAPGYGLSLEDETVEEDGSIVLTLQVSA